MKNSQPQLKNNIFFNNEAVRLSPERFDISDFTNSYKEIDSSKKEIVHYISSEGLNSKGQSLPISGYKDDLYRSNPRVFFNHGVDALWNEPSNPAEALLYNIGKNGWVKADKGYLKGLTIFKQDNPVAMDIFTAYENGFMDTWSKRWRPLSKIVYDEDGNITINEWSMREYSAVFLPADDGATTAMENGINEFNSDMFRNHIKGTVFTREINNDADVQKLIKEIEDLKAAISNNSDSISLEDIQIQINNSIELFAKQNQKRFLEIAGDVNNLAKSVNNRFKKMESEQTNKIIETVTGVIRTATGKV